MLELHKLGVLNPSQIMVLIESEFSETTVTWTKRDVQNLFQAHANHSQEAFEFIELLQQQKQNNRWEVEIQLNSENLRLQRIFWMSARGRDYYCSFSDVIEGDATYKTNRFGLPLLLFWGVDNNCVTFVIAGCLLSDEQFESYEWALLNFGKLGFPAPKVIFTDGDTEFGRAIQKVWPETVHLLCRFHIAQNIIKNLAGILREDLNDFLSDFWRVASLEDEDEAEYLAQLEAMKASWRNAVDYLTVLEAKQKKWAFAYTHQYFVAGMASTQ
jgi:zinc finger SWIM domain-containing protein 3